jgi:hypothetical protein
MKTFKFHELIRDMSSAAYHGATNSYSSSQLKDLLDDVGLFIKKHILKEVEREELPAFDVGTYFHTAVLEPEKLSSECAVFPGKIRRGKEWDDFKIKNKDKVVITSTQKEQAEGLIKSVSNSCADAKAFLKGTPEVSLFTQIAIHNGEIFCPHFDKVLTRNGWVDYNVPKQVGFMTVIKVRADVLGDTYITDLKSTTGNARSNRSMRGKISDYTYDLSAALYLDMFSLVKPNVENFVWLFASKDYFNARAYVASAANIEVGRAKYMTALLRLAECAKNDWELFDYVDTLEPLPHELEHLIIKDKDLL